MWQWHKDAWARIYPRHHIWLPQPSGFQLFYVPKLFGPYSHDHIALTQTPPSHVLLRDAHGIYHVLADDQKASSGEP